MIIFIYFVFMFPIINLHIYTCSMDVRKQRKSVRSYCHDGSTSTSLRTTGNIWQKLTNKIILQKVTPTTANNNKHLNTTHFIEFSIHKKMWLNLFITNLQAKIMWAQLSEEQKQSYGEDYFENALRSLEKYTKAVIEYSKRYTIYNCVTV